MKPYLTQKNSLQEKSPSKQTFFPKQTRKFLTFAFVNEFCVKSLLHYFLREKKCQ